MAVPSKTLGTGGNALLPWQTIATATQAISSAIDVSAKFFAGIFFFVGRASGTAFTTAPVVRVEASPVSSGNDTWTPVFEALLQLGASVGKTTLNGAVSAAATSCVVTSATNIAAGDLLFLGHTTTVGNYELVRVKSVSGTTVNFYEACTFAHDTGADVSDQAELFFCPRNLLGEGRFRVMIDNYAGGVSLYGHALAVTTDSIS